jgi:putative membrane protein
MIDFVTLMSVSAAAGLFVVACYVYWGLDDQDQKRWSPAFLVPGFVLAVTGLYMVFAWPLGKGVYASPYGEMSVLFGALLLGAGIALANEWNLIPVAIFGLFAGPAAMVFGVSFILLKLSLHPMAEGVSFILAGLGGVFALPTLYLRENRLFRLVGALILCVSAALLALSAYGGMWMHLSTWPR